jgi:choline dehydrogenase-like flavoprotein
VIPAERLGPRTLRCQYVVIGSGAGGSVAALELALAGKHVLILEEGGYVPTERFAEPMSDLLRALYRSGGVTPFWGSPPIGFAEGRCAGGGTTINGGLLWRTPPRILERWAREGGVRGYAMRDLEPHFTRIERMLNVSPQDHAEGNHDSELIRRASQRLGWRYAPAPRAVQGCVNTNRCVTGCPTGAKQGTLLTYLPQALGAGATLLPSCRAVRIEHAGRRALRVHARVGTTPARRLVIEPDHIILAGGAVQTPFLLRQSGLSQHAGRRLAFHANLKMVATFPERVNAVRGTIFTGQVQEFESAGLLMMASTFQPHYVASTLAPYGNAAIREVLRQGEHAALYVAQIQMESAARVHSVLGASPLVTYRLHPSDWLKIVHAMRRLAELLFAAGANALYPPVIGGAPITSPPQLERLLESLTPRRVEMVSVHAMSSCPMGPNPRRSVVDEEGRLHGWTNIIVCDASVLPTNIGESPQGTIMAMAHEILRRHLTP